MKIDRSVAPATARRHRHAGGATCRRRGFTLIELMIVVVIIAILAAIAIPTYLNYVRESRRSSAKTALLDLASREARYQATNNSFTGQLSSLGYANVSQNAITVPGNGEDYYSVTVAPASSAIQTYTATATPLGDQANDSCGTYSLTDTGVRTATGGASCW
jgi:type IV pilus assembly protein PilE